MSLGSFDVVVLGGGPAGASCALACARYRLDVALVVKTESKRQHVGESLPSSIRVLMEDLGVALPEDVVVKRPPEHLVFWGAMSGSRAWNDVPEQESSLLVWRGPFDECLRRAAVARGVKLFEDPVRRVAAKDGRRLVETSSGRALEARVVVDASGRSGVLARRYRQKESRFRTLALTGHFRTEEKHPPTIVEAFADGWVWSAPLRNGLRDVTTMVDQPPRGQRPDNHDNHDRHDRKTIYRRAVDHAKNVGALVDSAPLEGSIRGIDATPYDARPFCAPDFFLVGDAASFLDPLSSHGVHKAMDDAMAAAVSLRTLLERPSMTGEAVRFYEDRLRSIYRVTTERLRRLYAQETRYADREFWRRRSSRERSEERAPFAARPVVPPMPLMEGVKLAGSAGVTLAEAPVLEGDFIEKRKVLEAPGSERPVRFLGNICLPDIYEEVVASGDVYEVARRSVHGFERALAAIDWLYRAGYLEHRGGTEL